MEPTNLFYLQEKYALGFSIVLYFCICSAIIYKLLIKKESRRCLKKMLIAFAPLLVLGMYEALLFWCVKELPLRGSISIFSVKLFICSSFFVFIFFQSAGFVDDNIKNCILHQVVVFVMVLLADLFFYLFGMPLFWYVMLLSGFIIFVVGLFLCKFFQTCVKRFDTMVQMLKKSNFIGAFMIFFTGLLMSYITLIALFLYDRVILGIVPQILISLLHILLLYRECNAQSVQKGYKIAKDENSEEMVLMDGVIMDDYKIIQRLILYFETHKPYLEQDLKLADVSKHIYTNRTYLSRALNHRLSKNFNQFVNYYRVKEACRIYIENPLMKINEMSVKSGFKNLSSFSTAFSFNMRHTPAEWCREVKRRLNNKEHVCIEDYFK